MEYLQDRMLRSFVSLIAALVLKMAELTSLFCAMAWDLDVRLNSLKRLCHVGDCTGLEMIRTLQDRGVA
jgi:hypothetical protein